MKKKWTKARLFEEIVKVPSEVVFNIDKAAASMGHTVLRLPPYHCELNPIEMVWGKVKGYVSRKNTTYRLSDVKLLLQEGIEQVTSQNWANYCRHIENEEETFRRLDGLGPTVEPVRFIVNDTESGDSDLGEDD